MKRSERLRKLRRFRKLSQNKLAELIGASQGTITKLENDESVETKYLFKICKVLDCSSEWLEEGKGLSPFIEDNNRLPEGHIPIIPAHLVQQNPNWDILVRNRTGTILMSDAHPRRYALEVNDNSMILPNSELSLFIGDKIIIDPDKTPEHNDLVIIKYINANDFFIKQYIKEGNSIRLVSFDSNRYPPIEYNDQIEICGVIIEKRRVFKAESK